jgi:hypothetical protein
VSQKISDPTPAEQVWITDNLAAARELLVNTGGDATNVLEPSLLDTTWAAWLREHDPDEDPNPVINALGAAFGQHLVDRLGLAWKIVEDEHGTDLAVYGTPGDILIFPANLIAKRYEGRETHFIAAAADQIADRVMQVRASSGGRRLGNPFRWPRRDG